MISGERFSAQNMKLLCLLSCSKHTSKVQNTSVITFHQNNATRPIGRDTDVKVERDSYTIHQIVNSVKGKGNASKVMKEFFDWTGQDVYLTVRESNLAANSFYKKIGMQPVGYINWSGGKMSGRVWKFKS